MTSEFNFLGEKSPASTSEPIQMYIIHIILMKLMKNSST